MGLNRGCVGVQFEMHFGKCFVGGLTNNGHDGRVRKTLDDAIKSGQHVSDGAVPLTGDYGK